MKRLLLIITVIVFYLLHQDFWNWRAIYPLVFGFLPIGLFYHVSYTIAVTLLMWLLTRYAWPRQLEERAADSLRLGDAIPSLDVSASGRLRDSNAQEEGGQ